LPFAIEWRDDRLHLLDQRLLPHRLEYLACGTAPAVAEAIRKMVVRGAPAIGIAAAYGVVLAARDAHGDPEARLLQEARRIHEEDVQANRRMGELGAELIGERCAVLTHCNAGSLATGGFGTALGVIRAAFSAGRIERVYADETRPWLQGARLTAWELVQDGIPVTLLVEGAAAWLMARGLVEWVIVGADRIAANGDVANKIGTYSAAVNARRHGVKFMVVAPLSTIDPETPNGYSIPIEERPQEEILELAGQPLTAAGATAWNPSFDVTPAELIDAIVTERGVISNPDRKKLGALFQREGDCCNDQE